MKKAPMKPRHDKATTHLKKVEVVIRITPDPTASSRSVEQLVDELSEIEAAFGRLEEAIDDYMAMLDDRVCGEYSISSDHFEVRRPTDDDDDDEPDEGRDTGDEDDGVEDDDSIHLVDERKKVA